MSKTHRMNGVQRKIFECVSVKPKTVLELVEEIGVSAVYIRQQLNLLEQMDRVEKVDMRQPYIYMPKQINLEEIEKREKIKAAFKDKSIITEATPMEPYVRAAHRLPKDKWPQLAVSLRMLADIIEEMDEKGELIETLAD